jgi:Amt family ammonium transporter
MGVDVALDVLGVHGVGGALGSLLLPFAALLGAGGVTLMHPLWQQFGLQAEGVVAAALWSAIATAIITKAVALTIGLRVDREHEITGLDFASHGETGYHGGR